MVTMILNNREFILTLIIAALVGYIVGVNHLLLLDSRARRKRQASLDETMRTVSEAMKGLAKSSAESPGLPPFLVMPGRGNIPGQS